MISGGIAGKLGNRYEAKWVVRCLLDVIGNKAQWLNFESVETEYQGFEFALARGEITEWHQCKVNAPNGNWTINALQQAGILKAFSNRLSTSNNAHCWFISQDNARDFRTLTEDARTANSSEQLFGKILSIDQKTHFHQLKEAWQQTDDVVFDWLRRSEVGCLPERELDSFIDSHGDFYFQNGGKSAYLNLRDILENHFNKTLTKESTLAAIKSHGVLKFKSWAFDPSIPQRLKEKTEDYLETYTPFGAGGTTITRNQSTTLVDEILKPGPPDLILLTGVAGSGKSGIIRNAIEELRERDIPHLAFRVDWYLSCDTKEELGKKLCGREESPVSTLKGTFPITPSVLFIDQVDAVSEVSGREGHVREVIFRLITDAQYFEGVKIVIVCRTFDLESDARLKRLKEAQRTKQIDVPLLVWSTDVEPLLKNKGIDGSTFKEPQQQLLCLPVNLAVFMEIDDPDFRFHSRFRLHEKLIEKKQRTIFGKYKPTWHVLKPLTAICQWMSKRQRLSALVSVLDDYPGAADILCSEGLITSSRGEINFFHESFFDHVYARDFVNNEQRLVDFLRETEQHLFRRTQVRQILEALRQSDLERYFKELSIVLESSKIRFHIKAAICQWFNTIDLPSETEFKIVSRFNESSGKFHQFFRNGILSTRAWFDFLNEKNWIKEQLECDDAARTEAVLWWLSNIAGERPSEISALLRSWWGENEGRSERLLNWFRHVRRAEPDDTLLQLCEDIIHSHPTNLFKNQGRDRIMMLLHTWGKTAPEQCGQVLHSLFDAWFALHPQRNPLARDEDKVFDTHSLTELEKKHH